MSRAVIQRMCTACGVLSTAVVTTLSCSDPAPADTGSLDMPSPDPGVTGARAPGELATPRVEPVSVLASQSPNEPRIAATGARSVYVTTNDGISYSLDGGASFTRLYWRGIGLGADLDTPLVRECTDFLDEHRLGSRGDASVTASHGPVQVLGPSGLVTDWPAFSAVVMSENNANSRFFAMVVRAANDHRFEGAGIHCVFVPTPPGTAVIDKTSIAYADADRTAYVAWHDGGPPNGTSFAHSQIWLTAIQDWGPGLAPVPAAPTGRHPGDEAFPAYVTGEGDAVTCTATIDDAARPNIVTSERGDVYAAFTNNMRGFEATCGTHVHRVWVAKLTGQGRFYRCIDEFETTSCASQGHIEDGDADLVVDDVSGQIAVAYPRGRTGGRSVVLATSSMAGGARGAWHRTEMERLGAARTLGDQSHPAIALTHERDPSARAAEGTVFVTWYDPTGGPMAIRVGRGFSPDQGGTWRARTPVFRLDERDRALNDRTCPVAKTGKPPCTPGVNRGVHEYQGVTALFDHPTPGAGGWMAVWSGQSPDASPRLDPDDTYDVLSARW